MGVCSTCVNVTSTTNSTCGRGSFSDEKVCNYTTPYGIMLQTKIWSGSAERSYQTRIATDGRTGANETLATFASLTWPNAVDVYPSPTPSIEISECTLSWCAKVYRDASVNGRTFQATVDSYDLAYSGEWVNTSFVAPNQPKFAVLQAKKSYPASLNSTFTVQQANTRSLGDFVVRALRSANLTQITGNGDSDSSLFSFGAAVLAQESVAFVADRLSTSLTNAIRGLASPTTQQVVGQSHVSTQYIRVRWIWLIFPAVVVLLGLVLLVTTILASRRARAMAWKCSPLALLFHPLQGWNDDELDLSDAAEMKRSARAMRAQLLRDDVVGLRIARV